ncbi:dirigent protein 22-like [Lotus japonicus]|uniref:dirigent protein 22-like n=1 Tax=Lotus japonicus TaxID=34305 RepID=UPI002587F63D|nr:dirigent protein 22-like [Lotus japonicus]
MAISLPKFHPSSLIYQHPFIFIITISFLCNFTTAETHSFGRIISPSTLGLNKPQKLSHLRFYFHDIVDGPNQSAFRVAAAPSTNNSPTGFGAVVVMDDALTELPEMGSKVVGRAQGMYALASRSEVGLLMVLNFAFTEGKYNGSNLSVLGRNAANSAVREMPVVGGSGLFRFANGYAQARTHHSTTVEDVVEYNVFVFHY